MQIASRRFLLSVNNSYLQWKRLSLENARDMEIMNAMQAQLQKIDEQILDLLEERTHVCANGAEESEKTIDYWIDSAMYREMDETSIEKMCKVVMAHCKNRRN
ncbi:hypothetical protein A3D11_03240 [Candidatus Peribacteria bacterium RIFCSPHIGHO2_02_FULL_49_16]|nr:MAG: hypothetical protein A3D11_03240 [Candidatus Peribacteria bacterium RIFCSPHIGHO2_02_FULL_49_16]